MQKIFLALLLLTIIFLPSVSLNAGSSISSRNVVDAVNAERKNLGLESLTSSPLLEGAASAKASELARRNYLEHSTPEGKSFFTWIDEVGYKYTSAGENLAANSNTPDLAVVISSWMKSAGHRANIAANHFTETGVGVAYGNYEGKPAVYIVQIFATPAVSQTEQVRVVETINNEVVPSVVPTYQPITQIPTLKTPVSLEPVTPINRPVQKQVAKKDIVSTVNEVASTTSSLVSAATTEDNVVLEEGNRIELVKDSSKRTFMSLVMNIFSVFIVKLTQAILA